MVSNNLRTETTNNLRKCEQKFGTKFSETMNKTRTAKRRTTSSCHTVIFRRLMKLGKHSCSPSVHLSVRSSICSHLHWSQCPSGFCQSTQIVYLIVCVSSTRIVNLITWLRASPISINLLTCRCFHLIYFYTHSMYPHFKTDCKISLFWTKMWTVHVTWLQRVDHSEQILFAFWF